MEETLFATPDDADSTLARPVMIGPYRILGELGAGGMGKVYKAYHTQLDRVVAIKVMLESGQMTAKERQRFLAEARLTASLKHPNIVPVFDIGNSDGKDFIVMAFIQGKSLAALMKEKKLPQRQSLEIMRDVALAIAYAHENDIVHRDLKPENIMIEDDTGRAIVMDFGLAKNIKVGQELTKTGEILGTPRYMAPEQAQGKGRGATTLADVYSLGAILYELLSGTVAVEGITTFSIMYNLVNQEVIPLRQRNSKIAVDLETICQKALEKVPARRYDSAQAVADDIERFLNGEAIQARRLNLWELAGRKLWRYKAAVAAGIIISVVLFAGFAIWLGKQEAQTRRQEEQKQLVAWQGWWQEFQSAVQQDCDFLSLADTAMTEEQELIQAWTMTRNDRKIKSNKAAVFKEWENYDNKLYLNWSSYSQHLQGTTSLAAKYESLQQRYEKLKSEADRLSLSALYAHAKTTLSPVQQSYFGLAKTTGEPAQTVLQYFTKKNDGLCQEVQTHIQEYQNRQQPENIELATWLLAYILTSNKQQEQALQLQAQLKELIDTKYQGVLDILITIGPLANLEFKQENRANKIMELMRSAIEQLHEIVQMDCRFTPAYYKLARLYQQAGERHWARVCYEKSARKTQDLPWLAYTVEISFYDWRDYFSGYYQACQSLRSPNISDRDKTLWALRQKQCVDELVAMDKFVAEKSWQKFAADKEYAFYKPILDFYQTVVTLEGQTVQKIRVSNLAPELQIFRTFYLTEPGACRITLAEYDANAYLQGIANYQKALQMLESWPQEWRAQAAYLKGCLLFDLALLEEPDFQQDGQNVSYLSLAIAKFQEAVQWQSFYPEAWVKLGEIYYFWEDFEKARQALEMALHMNTLRNRDIEKYPWFFHRYWHYIECLLYLELKEATCNELEKLIRGLVEYCRKHPDQEFLHMSNLVRGSMLLSLHYWEKNDWDKLKEISQYLLVAQKASYVPGVEVLFYPIIQIKFKQRDQAIVSLAQVCRIPNIAMLLKEARKTPTLLPLALPLFNAYDNLFLVNPSVRKMPDISIPDPLNPEKRMSLLAMPMPKVLTDTGNELVLLRAMQKYLYEKEAIDVDFTQLMQEVSGVPMPLTFLFGLYYLKVVERLEIKLLRMTQLSSPELYYMRAMAYYRRGLMAKGRLLGQEALVAALQDITQALNQVPAEMKYHYGAAILCGHLAQMDATYQPRADFHLELALELGWNRADFTNKDPAFQSMRKAKKWTDRLAKAARPLYKYSWDEMAARIATLQEAGQPQLAALLMESYRQIVQKKLKEENGLMQKK